MRSTVFILALAFTVLAFPAVAGGKSNPAKEVGSGAANVGKGTAASVGNLATGHPVKSATSLGKGVGKGGAQIATGTGKAVGKGLKKLTHL